MESDDRVIKNSRKVLVARVGAKNVLIYAG
jgi:hypothetical protein